MLLVEQGRERRLVEEAVGLVLGDDEVAEVEHAGVQGILEEVDQEVDLLGEVEERVELRRVVRVEEADQVADPHGLAEQVRDQREPPVEQPLGADQPGQRVEDVADGAQQVAGEAADEVPEVEGHVGERDLRRLDPEPRERVVADLEVDDELGRDRRQDAREAQPAPAVGLAEVQRGVEAQQRPAREVELERLAHPLRDQLAERELAVAVGVVDVHARRDEQLGDLVEQRRVGRVVVDERVAVQVDAVGEGDGKHRVLRLEHRVVAQIEVHADPQLRVVVVGARIGRIVPGADEVEAGVEVDAEAEVEVPRDRDHGLEHRRDLEGLDRHLEGDGVQHHLDDLAEVELELQSPGVRGVRGIAVLVQEPVGRGSEQDAEPVAEHVVDDALDEPDQPVEVQVRLGDPVGERLEEVEAEVLDEIGGRIVGQHAAHERQVHAEQLAVQDVLQALQDGVQSPQDDAGVAEEREQARQRELAEVEVRHAQLGAVGAVTLAVEDLQEVDEEPQLVAGEARRAGEVRRRVEDAEVAALRRVAHRRRARREAVEHRQHDLAGPREARREEIAEGAEIVVEPAVPEVGEDQPAVRRARAGVDEVDVEGAAEAGRAAEDEHADRAQRGLELEVVAERARARAEVRAGHVDEERLVRADQIEPEPQGEVDAGLDPEVAGRAQPDELAEDPLAGLGEVEVEGADRLRRRREPDVEVEDLGGGVEGQDRRARRQAEQRPQARLERLHRPRRGARQLVDEPEELAAQVDEVTDAAVDHREVEVEHVGERRAVVRAVEAPEHVDDEAQHADEVAEPEVLERVEQILEGARVEVDVDEQAAEVDGIGGVGARGREGDGGAGHGDGDGARGLDEARLVRQPLQARGRPVDGGLEVRLQIGVAPVAGGVVRADDDRRREGHTAEGLREDEAHVLVEDAGRRRGPGRVHRDPRRRQALRILREAERVGRGRRGDQPVRALGRDVDRPERDRQARDRAVRLEREAESEATRDRAVHEAGRGSVRRAAGLARLEHEPLRVDGARQQIDGHAGRAVERIHQVEARVGAEELARGSGERPGHLGGDGEQPERGGRRDVVLEQPEVAAERGVLDEERARLAALGVAPARREAKLGDRAVGGAVRHDDRQRRHHAGPTLEGDAVAPERRRVVRIDRDALHDDVASREPGGAEGRVERRLQLPDELVEARVATRPPGEQRHGNVRAVDLEGEVDVVDDPAVEARRRARDRHLLEGRVVVVDRDLQPAPDLDGRLERAE